MEIISEASEKRLVLHLNGRIDAAGAIELETACRQRASGVSELILDFEKVPYIASAGLRVIVQTQKSLKPGERFLLRALKPEVREIFEITKLIRLLEIE